MSLELQLGGHCNMSTPFDELCKLGQKGDHLLSLGSFTEAFHVYADVHARMRSQRTIDSFIAAKLSLSSLLALIHMENLRGALQIWTSYRGDQPGEGFKDEYALGIWGLENGQVSLQDAVLYQQISGYLSSVCDQPEGDAERAVNHYFTVAHKISESERMPELRALLLNWRRCLDFALGGKEPKIVPVPLQGIVPSTPQAKLAFPRPSEWKITWESARASA